jgi:RNA recognition motif-containing protein
MNIFVAKLNYSTQERTVRSLFENFGTVSSCKIVFDREANRSKGFGFVEMPNNDEAVNAINALNGFELDERQIVVKQAEERPARSEGGDRPRFNSGNRPPNRGGYEKRSSGNYERKGGYERRGNNDYNSGDRDYND